MAVRPAAGLHGELVPGGTRDQGGRSRTRRLDRRLATRDGDTLLDLAGNDYLGLTDHAEVILGATTAARAYGGGAGASRLVSGILPVHDQLKDALAELLGASSALVFSTGYHANLGAVTALGGADILVISDAHIHASLNDAARLSRAQVAVAGHNDATEVERMLGARSQPRAMIVVESIYSVLGDAAPLKLDEIARRPRTGAHRKPWAVPGQRRHPR